MANKTVLVQTQVQAMNIDALNRSAVYADAEIENGMVFQLATQSTADGYSEVWNVTAPATGSLTGLWMAYEPEVTIISVNGKEYKGLTPDPRDFAVPAGKVFSAFKPVVGDIILVTAGGALDAPVAGNKNLEAANGTMKMAWANSQTANTASFALLATSYISIADGSIGTQRVVAYKLQCVAN